MVDIVHRQGRALDAPERQALERVLHAFHHSYAIRGEGTLEATVGYSGDYGLYAVSLSPTEGTRVEEIAHEEGARRYAGVVALSGHDAEFVLARALVHVVYKLHGEAHRALQEEDPRRGAGSKPHLLYASPASAKLRWGNRTYAVAFGDRKPSR